MRLGRAFILIRRINSLIPLGAILVVSAVLSYSAINDYFKPHSFIAPSDSSNDTKSSLRLHRHEFVDASKVWILSLDDVSSQHLSYETYSKKTKNLLLASSVSGVSHWIFPDQSNEIHAFEIVKDRHGSISAIYLNTSQELNTRDGLEDVYLSHPFRGPAAQILSGIQNVVDRRVIEDEMHIIYMRSNELRVARASLVTFKLLSDFPIANVQKF